ncbi:MAG: hypothetical protein OIF32_12220 [Campylobacterales bacterium]|nr:hypothetical protein [Campylobacterales bacterium]
MKSLGKCPFCQDGQIEVREGETSKSYACSNARWTKEYDFWELTKDSTCSFSVNQRALLRWNKKSFSEKEMRAMLSSGETKVRLYSGAKKTEYFKYVVPNLEFGLEVLWDVDIDA